MKKKFIAIDHENKLTLVITAFTKKQIKHAKYDMSLNWQEYLPETPLNTIYEIKIIDLTK